MSQDNEKSLYEETLRKMTPDQFKQVTETVDRVKASRVSPEEDRRRYGKMTGHELQKEWDKWS